MGRPTRDDFPGAWHHVVNRGARRAPLYRRDEHCGLFLSLLGEASERYRLEVHAYALMENHYHLLVRSPHVSLSRTMSFLGGEYTRAVNRLHGWDGPVFKGRFSSQVVDSTKHLLSVLGYIHLNPVRARLIRRVDQAYWTSHRAYLDKDAPYEWLRRDSLLGLVGGKQGLADFVRDLRSGRVEWPQELDMDTGFFALADDEPKKKRPARDRRTPKVVTPEVVLRRVRSLTAVGAAELERAERGRGANPARRFAVWALVRDGLLSYRQVGELLAMSAVQVGHTMRALRGRPSAELGAWIDAWEEKYGI